MAHGHRFAHGGVSAVAAHARPDGFEAGESERLMLGGGLYSPVQRSLMKLKIAANVGSFRPLPCAPQADIHQIVSRQSEIKHVPRSSKQCATRGSRNARHSKPQLAESDMLAAVNSLYTDQLKPYGRILRKRLGERGVVMWLAPGEPGLHQLRTLCTGSAWLSIESEQGGEWSASLVGVKANFVDVYSPADPYAPEFWAAAACYFERLEGNAMILPGGRFSCAQCLLARNLPFLANFSLGQVCHIVQLAISQRKLLGYSADGIAPYAHSQSMLKDRAAAKQSACASLAAGVEDLPLATWDSVRRHLREALSCAMQDGADSVPLSNIKRIFRSQFLTDLSETALGHSKLSELLQDIRLHDTCTVKLRDQGYFVIPQFRVVDKTTLATPYSVPGRVVFCPDEPLCLEDASDDIDSGTAAEAKTKRWFRPLPLSQEGGASSMVRNTFIHAGPILLSSATRRSRSLPKDFDSDWHRQEMACSALGFTNDAKYETRKDTDDPLRTPSPWTSRHEESMPLLYNFASQPPPYPPQAEDGAQGNRFNFCVDDSLRLKGLEGLDNHFAPESPTLTASPCWSPRPAPSLINSSRHVVNLLEFV